MTKPIAFTSIALLLVSCGSVRAPDEFDASTTDAGGLDAASDADAALAKCTGIVCCDGPGVDDWCCPCAPNPDR